MKSEYRYYDKHKPYKLKTWVIKRCKLCGRFIGGCKQFLCPSCYKKRHKEQMRNANV